MVSTAVPGLEAKPVIDILAGVRDLTGSRAAIEPLAALESRARPKFIAATLGSMSSKLNLADAFASFEDTWSPRLGARIDDFAVKLVKLDGEFVWHHHDDADELFLVHRGRLTLRFRDRDDVELAEGDLYVVPRGVEHLPVAEPGCEVVLLERADVQNTGSAGGDRTEAPKPL